jgi:alpha-ketoglutarate-dependent taurine dioxygenase
MTMFSPSALRDDLRERGFAVVRAVSSRELADLTSALGKVIGVSQVRLNPLVGSYLASPEPIPEHTDHPDAQYVAWMCQASDVAGGENLLVDGRAVIEGLPMSVRKELSDTRLTCPELKSLAPIGASAAGSQRLHPVWEEERRTLFFAPWLPRPPKNANTLERLARLIRSAPHVHILLAPGDALVVDNQRVLHAREALPCASRRWLTRYWIQQSDRTTTTRSLSLL